LPPIERGRDSRRGETHEYDERDPEELRQTAYHEAGHAVVAARLGILRMNSILTIIPDENGGVYGSLSFSKKKQGKSFAELLAEPPSPTLVHDSGKKWSERYTRKYIVVSYAGPAVSKKLNRRLDLYEEGVTQTSVARPVSSSGFPSSSLAFKTKREVATAASP
jgi:hypothetical protein